MEIKYGRMDGRFQLMPLFHTDIYFNHKCLGISGSDRCALRFSYNTGGKAEENELGGLALFTLSRP